MSEHAAGWMEPSLESVINQVPVHVFWLDRNNVCLGCNQLQAESLGYSVPSEVVGLHLVDFLHSEEWEVVAKNNLGVIESGQAKVFEELCTDSLGVSRIYLSHKAPLLNDHGQVVGVLGVSQDITRLKQEETTLLRQVIHSEKTKEIDLKNVRNLSQCIIGDDINAKSFSDYVAGVRNYFENIIAIMPGHVYWHNREGVMLGCNNNQANTLGLDSRKDIFGKTYTELLPPVEASIHKQTLEQVVGEGKSVILEEMSTSADNKLKYYYSQKKPIKDQHGAIVGLLGYSLDITQRKEAELELIKARKKAEIANQAKSEFLMNMSHDLRTPCSGILGFAKIMHDQEDDPSKKQQLEYILKSSQHLLNLLSEILDFTKVEDGSYRAVNNKFNLRVLIKDVIELLFSEILRKKLTVEVIYAETLPENILSDPVILHRILLNLLSNAVKFTESGSIVVTIFFKKVGTELSVSIRDTGIGIAEKDINTIFERFTRLSPSFDGIHRGTGLGLSTVSKLLTHIDGGITVNSEAGVGSEFIITVPIQLADECNASEAEVQVHLPPHYRHLNFVDNVQRRVLVVEDDFISRQVSKSLFESFKADVKLVDNGRQALCDDLSSYDLILTDIGLPDINGFDLVKEIRQWEQVHRVECPCVIMGLTAHIAPSYLERMADSGLTGLLQKPLTREIIEQL